MKLSANNDYFLFGAMKPNALPWRVDRRSDGAVLGWFSHLWKAVRAARRGFGGLDEVSVLSVPGDQYVSMWRSL